MKRNILSVVLGLTAAIIIFLVAEAINRSRYPSPADLNYNDLSAVKIFHESQPPSFWLFILTGWAVGATLCGLLIKFISRNHNRALPTIAAGLLTLSAVANFISLPHPTWFIVLGLVIFFPFTFLGYSAFKSSSEQ